MIDLEDDFTPEEREFFSTRGQDGPVAKSQPSSTEPARPELQKPLDPSEQIASLAGGPAADRLGQKSAQTNPNPVRQPATQERNLDPQGQEAPKLVPVNALHEEREKRRKSDEEKEQMRLEYARDKARIEERLKVLNDLLGLDPEQPKKNQAEEWIDPEKDIFGAFKQLKSRYDEIDQKLAGKTTEFQQRFEQQSLESSYQNDARRFMTEEPAFADAYRHLVNGRMRELEMFGIGANDAERSAIVAQEERQIVQQAQKVGKRPAQAIFELAKTRGFLPQAKSTPPMGETQQNSAPNQQLNPTLETIQRGMQAFSSLSTAGGASNKPLTFQDLVDMHEDQFEQVYSRMSEADRRRALGG
jgi:hypothetical protein